MAASEEISSLLEEVDADFYPRLSSQVSIPIYAEKIVKNSTIFSIRESGRLTAFVALYCNDRVTWTAYMSMLCVAKGRRKDGLATGLVRNGIDYLANLGFLRLRLEVYKNNSAAVNFYRRLDFISVGENEKSHFMELALVGIREHRAE
ncbi:GNAT family N-acetyltransferase [Caenimonas terrae]|uniref:GNAT family N-acetyltransferase n=1 Tax=Caenimonas terrae TaxID=696074 RepID=A0ABW0NCY8_9BURK